MEASNPYFGELPRGFWKNLTQGLMLGVSKSNSPEAHIGCILSGVLFVRWLASLFPDGSPIQINCKRKIVL